MSFEVGGICDFRSESIMLYSWCSLGGFASDWVKIRFENRNRELVRPSGGILRVQNQLQSSCSMSFVARNHQLSAQLRLSFEIGVICDFGSGFNIKLLGGLTSDW